MEMLYISENCIQKDWNREYIRHNDSSHRDLSFWDLFGFI